MLQHRKQRCKYRCFMGLKAENGLSADSLLNLACINIQRRMNESRSSKKSLIHKQIPIPVTLTLQLSVVQ